MATGGAPAPGQPPNPHPVRDFFIGLGLGLIPGILAIIGVGAVFHPQSSPGSDLFGGMLVAGAILYGISFIAMIVLLSLRRTQALGVGMLVSIVINPVNYFFACVVIVSGHPIL
ncbi:MAG TPA: hypothetical protein VGR57_02350 [Ktedonobacterales bacterium]|nr:hypothetical protein [Ktedonobacterales bacterium]